MKYTNVTFLYSTPDSLRWVCVFVVHWFLYYILEIPGTGVLGIGMFKVKTVEVFGPVLLFLSDVRLGFIFTL